MTLNDVLLMPINKIKKLIGTTTDTGGSSTTGTVMGKLNAIATITLNNQGSIMDDENLYLPKIKFEPLLTETDVSTTQLYVQYATSEKVYCSTSDGKVVIFDAKTMQKVGETVAQTGECRGLVVYQDKIYYCNNTDYKIIMFDDNTYTKLGETAIQTNVCRLPVVENDILYCLVYTNKIVAFDANTLQTSGDPIIVTTLGSIFVNNGIIYVGTSSGIKLYNAITRSYIGVIDSGTNRANLFIDNNILFATDYGTSAKKVYLYDITTRQKIGETAEQNEHCQFIFVEDGIIYFVASGYVYRIDVATRENIDGSFEINTGTTYAYVKDGNVYYSDLTTANYKAIKLELAYQISHYEKKVIE